MKTEYAYDYRKKWIINLEKVHWNERFRYARVPLSDKTGVWKHKSFWIE